LAAATLWALDQIRARQHLPSHKPLRKTRLASLVARTAIPCLVDRYRRQRYLILPATGQASMVVLALVHRLPTALVTGLPAQADRGRGWCSLLAGPFSMLVPRRASIALGALNIIFIDAARQHH